MERRLYASTSVYKIEKENKSNKKEIQNEHKIKKIIKINGKPKKKQSSKNPPKKPKKATTTTTTTIRTNGRRKRKENRQRRHKRS